MQSIDTITFLLHARDMGAIQDSTIINWADSQISSCETPAGWLLEMSLAKSTQDILALLEENGAAPEISDQWFLAIVAELYLKKGIKETRTTKVLYERFCLCNPNAKEKIHKEIYAIDDELNWNPAHAAKRLSNLLKTHLSAFENRLSQLTD